MPRFLDELTHQTNMIYVLDFAVRTFDDDFMIQFDEDDEQYLYSLYVRRALYYVGITDCWTRRMSQHRRDKDWFPEITTIKLKRIQGREAVEAAERKAIRSKRPLRNIQHNRAPVMEISAEEMQRGMASLAALVCGGLLGVRWAADAGSNWWTRQRSGEEPVVLPPVRNPFAESPPSLLLNLMKAYSEVASGKTDLPLMVSTVDTGET